MNKKSIITALLAIVCMTGLAKEIIWEQPTTEYGTSYGDGFFNLALDVTRVELKDKETVVFVTAHQRSDYPDFSFQFAGDTYLKVGDQRYPLVKADGIELNKFVQTNKEGKRDMAFHFPALPKETKSFDFIEGDGNGAFQIKGIKPVEERWKQLFPSYWRDDKGDWKIAFFEDCAIYDCKFWNYKRCDVNPKTHEAEIVMTNGNDELKDFDIAYLYLANRSTQESWENVIKEYNVSGPNVAHYNLPAEQQDAIERYLNVHSFPTYKLFNHNGELLNLEVDPRNLDNLVRLLDQME